MSESDCKSVQEKSLRSFCIRILLKVKVPQKEAEVVAGSLVSADLRGVSTHGVILWYIVHLSSASALDCRGQLSVDNKLLSELFLKAVFAFLVIWSYFGGR